MKIGEALKLFRSKKGLKQNQMALELGISQNYLSLIESCKKEPTMERLSEFAHKLKISKDALVFLSSEPPTELGEADKKAYGKLQMNILSLILYQMNGD